MRRMPQTAVTEMAFYRPYFFRQSPGTPWPTNPAEYTAFSSQYETKKAIDLTKGKYGADRKRWTHVTDYSHCQEFADNARAAMIEAIRYASVRDSSNGMNIALLTCRAFASHQPTSTQTWHIRLSDAGAQAICESPKSGITFHRDTFRSRSSYCCYVLGTVEKTPRRYIHGRGVPGAGKEEIKPALSKM